MNVLHLDEQLGWRGGEQQAAYLIRGLSKRGHRVVVAGRPRSPFMAHDFGVEIVERVEAPFLGEMDLWSAGKIAQAVRKHGIDILHAHTSHAHTIALIARALVRAKGFSHCKVVVSRRVDFAPRNHWFNRWKYAAPDHIVAISGRIAEVLRGCGVNEERLTVVHSGIDPARLDAPPLSRSELDVPERAPLFWEMWQSLVGHKDHATLIAAMPRVLKELPELRLVIAGEGELRPAIEAQIKALGVGESVKLLGYRKDVPGVLRALDVFVLSSKMEGLGTTVLDAMACGLPVVATDGGGLGEMVHHEKTGLLTPRENPEALAAAIVRLFRDKGLARRLAENGRVLVSEQFTADRMVEGNLQVYERVLGNSTG